MASHGESHSLGQRTAIERAGLAAPECVVVEDTERGMLLAVAGIRCLVIPNALNHKGDFSAAHRVSSNVCEVAQVVSDAIHLVDGLTQHRRPPGFFPSEVLIHSTAVISAVIFDCDGVLFDSWRANVAFYNAILQRLGLPPMDAEWERHAHTMASSQLFDAMFANDAELLERARSTAREIDYGPFYELMDPVDGLHEVLAGLRRTYRLAMASNRSSTAIGVVRRFELEQYLHHTAGVGDGIRPKPHPDMLLVCLERLEVSAQETVFVGDSPSDRDAARAAGIHFIAIGEQELDAPRVSTLIELPAFLAGC